MPDPLRRLLSRLDGGPVLVSAEERRDLAEDWDALAAAGLLAETISATAVECASCDNGFNQGFRSRVLIGGNDLGTIRSGIV